VAGEEGPFQLLQLPAVEVGARSAPFAAAGAVVVRPIAASSITCNMTTQLLRQPAADTFRMREIERKKNWARLSAQKAIKPSMEPVKTIIACLIDSYELARHEESEENGFQPANYRENETWN
jgi:hypothetical protein